jgi:hypothetical protein
VMALRRYEKGERSPSIAIVSVLAELAGVPPGWVLGDVRSTSALAGDAREFPEVPREGIAIVGHIEAELMRREDGEEVGGPQEAFETVERRVLRMRADGRLGDAGWNYWLALRRGAVLSGGYDPPEVEPPESGFESSGQSIA